MTGRADSLESQLSSGLERLDTFSGYDSCFGDIPIWRSPINFGVGIGLPDRQYDEVSLTIVNNGLWWRAHMQGACPQGLEFIDPVEFNLLSTGGPGQYDDCRTYQRRSRDNPHRSPHGLSGLFLPRGWFRHRFDRGFLTLLARYGEQHFGLALDALASLLRRSWRTLLFGNTAP